MRKDAHFNEKSRRKRFLWYERNLGGKPQGEGLIVGTTAKGKVA